MLNSAEPKIYPAHKCSNANNCWYFNIYEHEKLLVGGFEAKISTNFDNFNIYEQLKFHAQLS